MNENKTKLMTNGRRNAIYLNEKLLGYVNNYIYVGKQILFEDKNEEQVVGRGINMS